MTDINTAYSRPLDVHRWSEHKEATKLRDYIWDMHFAEEFPAVVAGKKPKADYRKQFKVLLLDLYVAWIEDPDLSIGVAMGKGAYKEDSRYNKLYISYNITKVIRHAHQEGLIDWKTGSEAANETTRIRASEKLIDYFRKTKLTLLDFEYPDKEVIILNNRNEKQIPYKDSDFEPIVSMRDEVHQYNKLLWRTHIDIPTLVNPIVDGVKIHQLNKFVRRIFYRGSWELGGRFHGGFWQQIGSAWRKQIYINGDATVEIDYSGLHINLLYGLKKHQPPQEDHYVIDHVLKEFSKEEQRKIVKELILMAINVDNEKKAFNAFRHEQLKDSKAKALKDNQLTLLLDAFKTKHPLIKDDLCTGVGNTLMNIDGRIAALVVNHFTNKDIPVLTIHDSYIVERAYEVELMDVMNQSISNELDGYKINIKKEVISSNQIQSMKNMVPISEKEDFKYSSVTSFKETKEYKTRENNHNEWLKEYI